MNKDPKLAIVFPGQGSQIIGMLDNLITIDKKAREIVNIASDILGYDILKIISDGPKEKLDSTEVTQPAILLTSYVTWLLWKHESNTIPSVLAGHSLGEYTALLCADIISFEDAIMIVSERGKYMQQSVPDSTGAMAAILGLDDSLIEQLCSNAAEDEIVSAANYNSPGQVVVSGHKNAVNRMINLAKNAGARRAILLPVSVPSHCALMKDTANKFSKLLDKITFNNAQIPILQNVDAKLKTNAADIKTALIKQLYEPVRWVDTINEIHRIGVTKIIECGPNNVLSGLIKRIEKSFELFSISDKPSLDKTLI
ncbi:MAG: [acyl-carrier-protein] S-malonyltransferase [Legionellales bacterium]|nr:[acyl-carrier-protein] S-malonyltransferase [Legionellales bacterium]